MVTVPTTSDFAGSSVMNVVRNIVDYLTDDLVAAINSDIAGIETGDTISAITIGAGSTDGTIRVTITTGAGSVVSNDYALTIEGDTEITISQSTSGITINGTALQNADTSQPGLMTAAYVTQLNTATSNVTSLTTRVTTAESDIDDCESDISALETLIGTDADLITS